MRILAVASRAKIHAVVGLVDDNYIVAAAFQKLENALLFKKVYRGQAKGDMVERVSAEFCGFADLLKPATVDHIRNISLGGERMPAKSTYFYPKLLSGLVINPLA